MKKQGSLTKAKSSKPSVKKTDLLQDLRNMIDQAKRSVALVVNTHLIALNWQIGHRIHSEILKKKRAGYGEEILATVSQELTKEYGQGFTLSSLSRMLKFAELFPDKQIESRQEKPLSTELGTKAALPRYVVLQPNFEGTPTRDLHICVPSLSGSLLVQ